MALAAISLIGNVYLGYYMLFGLASDGLGLGQQSGGVVVTDVGEQTADGARRLSNRRSNLKRKRAANRDGGGLVRATDEF